jgi:hypothetical protein
LKNLVDLALFFDFLLALLHLCFEIILAHLVENVLNTKVLIRGLVYVGCVVSRDLDIINVKSQSVQTHQEIGVAGMHDAVRTQSSDDFALGGHASTRNVARLSLNETTPTIELVEMRIMNVAVDLLTSSPRKCGMTARAPHLIASGNLGYKFTTTRALFAVTAEQTHGFAICFVAHMVILAFKSTWRVAFGASVLVTYATLPRRREESATVGLGTMVNERASIVARNGRGNLPGQSMDGAIYITETIPNSRAFGLHFRHETHVCSALNFLLDIRLGRRHHGVFSFEQDILAVLLVSVIDKCR